MPYSERKEPTYKLLRIENLTATSFVVVYEQDTEYKKVLRYYTENYIRYPVYSKWLTESKEIQKKCGASPKALEALPSHKDPLFSSFSYEIIALAYPEDVSHWPSWFQRERFTRIHEKKKKEILFSHQSNQAQLTSALKEEEFALIKLQKELAETKKALVKENALQEKAKASIEETKTMKKNVALDVLSLGIRGYRHSSLRLWSLSKKLQSIEERIAGDNEKINGICKDISEHEKKRDSFKEKIEEDNATYSKRNALNDAWLMSSLEGVVSLASKKKKNEEAPSISEFDVLDIKID